MLQSLGIEERFANFVSKRVELFCKGGRVSVARARPPPGLTLTANAPMPKQSAVRSLKLSPAEKPTVVPTSMNLAEENHGDAYLQLWFLSFCVCLAGQTESARCYVMSRD